MSIYNRSQIMAAQLTAVTVPLNIFYKLISDLKCVTTKFKCS